MQKKIMEQIKSTSNISDEMKNELINLVSEAEVAEKAGQINVAMRKLSEARSKFLTPCLRKESFKSRSGQPYSSLIKTSQILQLMIDLRTTLDNLSNVGHNI